MVLPALRRRLAPYANQAEGLLTRAGRSLGLVPPAPQVPRLRRMLPWAAGAAGVGGAGLAGLGGLGYLATQYADPEEMYDALELDPSDSFGSWARRFLGADGSAPANAAARAEQGARAREGMANAGADASPMADTDAYTRRMLGMADSESMAERMGDSGSSVEQEYRSWEDQAGQEGGALGLETLNRLMQMQARRNADAGQSGSVGEAPSDRVFQDRLRDATGAASTAQSERQMAPHRQRAVEDDAVRWGRGINPEYFGDVDDPTRVQQQQMWEDLRRLEEQAGPAPQANPLLPHLTPNTPAPKPKRDPMTPFQRQMLDWPSLGR